MLSAHRVLVAGLCTAAPLLAQPQVSPATSPISILRQSVGARQLGEVILGEGSDYRVRFDRGGVTFAASRAGDAAEMRYRLREVRRGDTVGLATEAATPVLGADGRTIRYERLHVVERYELRPEGVEQSFVLSDIPPGSGDLIVRGTLETGVPLTSVAHDELRFGAEGRGGIRIGKVLGIDARDERVEGSLRLLGDTLEITLPASFVDDAVLPLVVDPLIGGISTLGGTGDDEFPDVAYDLTNDVYLVVWQRLGTGLRGQRVRGDGALVGGTVFIRDGPAYMPSVANVNKTNAFAVVWHENNSIWAVGVNAATGTASSETLVSRYRSAYPDIGGAATLTDDEAMVVYMASVSSTWIEATLIQVPTTGAPSVVGSRALSVSGGTHKSMATISKSSGDTGNFFAAWRDTNGGDENIHGIVVDRDLNFVTPLIKITETAEDNQEPDVDGDGMSWVVAYEIADPFPSFHYDIACRGVYLHPDTGQAYLSPSEIVIEDGRESEVNPCVAWMGSSALIAFSEEKSGTDYDAYVKSIDPFRYTECEGTFALATSGLREDFPIVASKRSGGSSDPEALIVWQRDFGTTDDDVQARRFEVESGIEIDLGGGCGTGGTTRATCARAGNGAFTMRLRHAGPAQPAGFVLSARRADAPCGTCVFMPDPVFGVVLYSGVTDAQGNLALRGAIPANPAFIGAHLYQQFLIPGTRCGFYDLSSALEFEIQ